LLIDKNSSSQYNFCESNKFANLHSNQRKQLQTIIQKFNIKEANDWYSVPREEVYKLSPFIKNKYGNLLNALKDIYPQHPWDASQFSVRPKGTWNNLDMQKKQLERLAEELNIKHLDDWYNVSLDEVNRKMWSIKQYFGSLFNALTVFYPNHNWDRSKLVSSRAVINHRKKLEKIATTELNIKELDDWYVVKRKFLYQRLPWIQRVYGDLFTALKTVYPHHNWNPLRFKRVHNGLWNQSNENLFKRVLSDQILHFNIDNYSDWLTLPPQHLNLFKRIAKNAYTSRRDMLLKLFPEINWRMHHNSSRSELMIQVKFVTKIL
jgi:hypothetical protein